MGNQGYAGYAAIFKAIGDETRLKILDMLSCGQMCACQLLEGLAISQPTLSYHMKILTESGLVVAMREGAWMKYMLNQGKLDTLQVYFKRLTSTKEDCICKKYYESKTIFH